MSSSANRLMRSEQVNYAFLLSSKRSSQRAAFGINQLIAEVGCVGAAVNRASAHQ
jgi:hypothetical protein